MSPLTFNDMQNSQGKTQINTYRNKDKHRQAVIRAWGGGEFALLCFLLAPASSPDPVHTKDTALLSQRAS